MSKEVLLGTSDTQGCCLSFPLYCIQNVMFSFAILKYKKIKGPIYLTRKKTSSYPNIHMTQVSSHVILRTYPYISDKFSKYKIITGYTLNVNKTKYLLIQTNTVGRICQKYTLK